MELITNDFKYLKDMLDTMVDVNIKDKEESIKQLMNFLSFFTSCHNFMYLRNLVG